MVSLMAKDLIGAMNDDAEYRIVDCLSFINTITDQLRPVNILSSVLSRLLDEYINQIVDVHIYDYTYSYWLQTGMNKLRIEEKFSQLCPVSHRFKFNCRGFIHN